MFLTRFVLLVSLVFSSSVVSTSHEDCHVVLGTSLQEDILQVLRKNKHLSIVDAYDFLQSVLSDRNNKCHDKLEISRKNTINNSQEKEFTFLERLVLNKVALRGLRRNEEFTWIADTRQLREMSKQIPLFNAHQINTKTLDQRCTEAYATILTSDSIEYFLSALVLGWSIDLQESSGHRCKVALVVRDTGIPDSFLEYLRKNSWRTMLVEAIPEFWFNTKQCKYRTVRGTGQEVRWGRMASKLHIFNLTDFSKVLYLDSDVLVTGNIENLFGHNELVAFDDDRRMLVGEGGTGHQFVNAGMLLVRPAKETFIGIIAYANTHGPRNLFPNLVDCTEQALINAYFLRNSPSSAKPGSLSDGNELSRRGVSAIAALASCGDCRTCIGRPDVHRNYWIHPPYAVHFLRVDRCPKPWSLFPKLIKRMPEMLAPEASVEYISAEIAALNAKEQLKQLIGPNKACDYEPYEFFLDLTKLHIFT